MIELNFNKILEHEDYFKKTTEYIPIVLHRFVDTDYYNRLSDKDKQKFYKVRTQLQGASDYNEFLERDLVNWLKTHKEFEDIING